MYGYVAQKDADLIESGLGYTTVLFSKKEETIYIYTPLRCAHTLSADQIRYFLPYLNSLTQLVSLSIYLLDVSKDTSTINNHF